MNTGTNRLTDTAETTIWGIARIIKALAKDDLNQPITADDQPPRRLRWSEPRQRSSRSPPAATAIDTSPPVALTH